MNAEKLEILEKSLIELGSPEICNRLLPHIHALDIVDKSSLKDLIKSVKDKKCNFYYKCRRPRKDCGANLPLPFRFLSIPEKTKVSSYKKKEDGEE